MVDELILIVFGDGIEYTALHIFKDTELQIAPMFNYDLCNS